MNFLTRCSILHGCLAGDGTLYVTLMNDALAEEREQHAIPLVWRHGAWACVAEEPFLPWLAAGVTAVGTPPLAAIVGWGGQVLTVGPDGCGREGLQRQDGRPVAVVRSVAAVDGVLYAFGMRRQAYRRLAGGRWEAIDGGVAASGEDGADVAFEALDGLDAGRLYGAGLSGEIWRRRDDRWQAIASPTNVHLSAVCCASDGTTYIGGRTGTLMRGADDTWDIRALDTADTIWDACQFRDKLYLRMGSDVATYDWDNDVLLPLPDIHDATGFACNGEHLLVLGRKRIVSCDGAAWRPVATELDDAAIPPPLRQLLA